jgi:hypothetical protein
VENGSILVLKAKVYSCSSRARGLLNSVFFFINNRVLGVISIITLGYRTYMRIFFLQLIEF